MDHGTIPALKRSPRPASIGSPRSRGSERRDRRTLARRMTRDSGLETADRTNVAVRFRKSPRA
eukprot:5229337-Pyramimonas_sp.AAC.1